MAGTNDYLGSIGILPYTHLVTGYAYCNGGPVSVPQNTALFSLLGTTFGGDGVKVFNLPNLIQRVVVGVEGTPNPGEVLEPVTVTSVQSGVDAGPAGLTLPYVISLSGNFPPFS